MKDNEKDKASLKKMKFDYEWETKFKADKYTIKLTGGISGDPNEDQNSHQNMDSNENTKQNTICTELHKYDKIWRAEYSGK